MIDDTRRAVMTAPVRLRLSRAKDFNLQTHSHENNGLPAVVVARPSRWGNPFTVGRDGTRAQCVQDFALMIAGYHTIAKTGKVEDRIALAEWMRQNVKTQLSGQNLACWCALDGKPCHGDVLLALANCPDPFKVDMSQFMAPADPTKPARLLIREEPKGLSVMA